MRRKNIRYSNHAIQRKLERDISDAEITKTLTYPDYTISSFEGRKVAMKRIGERTINVVYKEEKTYMK